MPTQSRTAAAAKQKADDRARGRTNMLKQVAMQGGEPGREAKRRLAKATSGPKRKLTASARNMLKQAAMQSGDVGREAQRMLADAE